jgi:hypothetical protein
MGLSSEKSYHYSTNQSTNQLTNHIWEAEGSVGDTVAFKTFCSEGEPQTQNWDLWTSWLGNFSLLFQIHTL